MTIETRTTIELKDVKAIEFECPHCHVKTVMPLAAQFSVPTDCRSCHQTLMIHGSDEYADMHRFLDRLIRYAASERSSFILRFEISGITEKQKL